MPDTNETAYAKSAEARYGDLHAEAVFLLDEIRASLFDSPAPDFADWGDVADIARTRDALREIADRLLDRGEYAPENIAT